MTTINYTLKRPIRLKPDDASDTSIITELAINDDPDCGDIAVIDGVEGDIHKTIAIIAALAGIPYTTAKRLKPADFQALNLLVKPIIEGGSGNA